VTNGFKTFLNLHVQPLLKQEPNAPVCFTGSVAANFQDYLQLAAADLNITITNVIKEPINNLLSYYANKN
jgi:glucosamine kinase